MVCDVQSRSDMATREDVQAILGDLDDLVIERIVESGATSAEIAEALAGVEEAQRVGEQPMPSSAKVVEVRAILQDLATDDDDDGVIYERDLHP